MRPHPLSAAGPGIRPLLAAAWLSSMSIGAVFALLAALQDRYGFADWGLGLVSGSSFLASLIAQLALSRYADRGHARLLLRLGVVLAAAGTLAVAAGGGLATLVAARVGTGLGAGMIFPAARRVFVHRFPGREGEALGWLLGADVGGFVAGPLFAAVAARFLGLQAPFVLLAVGVLAVLPAVARVEQPPALAEAERRVMRALIRLPRVRAGLFLGAALFAAVGAFDTAWARYLTDRGATTGVIAVTLTIFALPLVLLPSTGGRVGDRLGPLRSGLVSSMLTVPLLAAYGLVPGIWWPCTVALVNSIFDSLTAPSAQAVVARSSPPQLVAAGQGLYGATEAAAGAASAFLVGPLLDLGGQRVMWLAVAGAVGLLTLGSAWTGRRGNSQAQLSE